MISYYYHVLKLLFLLICIICLYTCSPKIELPKAKKGIINLRDREFDPSTPSTGSGTVRTVGIDGIFKLDGEWEFFWKEFPLIGEDEKLILPDKKKDYLQIPGNWNSHIDKNNGFGYGTYRLKILIKEPIPLSLRIPVQSSAYKVFIDNQLVLEVGRVGIDSANSIPEKMVIYKAFIPKTDEIDITIAVSNYHQNQGGLFSPITIGSPEQISKIRVNNLALELFVAGILAIMGIYHLSLFYLRRDDLSAFYFGLFCILICFRTTVMGEVYLKDMFPELPFSSNIFIEYISIYLGLPIFIEFISTLYPHEIIYSLKKSIIIPGYIFSAIAIFTSPIIFTSILIGFQIILLLGVSYTIYVIIKAALNKREGAKIILIGFFIFAIAIINDLLLSNNIINTNYCTPYGLVAFIFSQAFLLTSRFANTFHQLKYLSLNLEKKIAERTSDLEEANLEVIKSKEIVESSLRKANNLNEMMEVIIQSKLVDEMFQKIYELFINRYNINSYLVYIYDKNDYNLKLYKIFGDLPAAQDYLQIIFKNQFSINEKNCVHGVCFNTRKSFLMKNVKLPHKYKPEEENIIGGNITSFYIIPLVNENESFGTITFSDNKFQKSEINKLTKPEREEIEKFIKLISPSIFQSFQKKIIEHAYLELQVTKSELENQKFQMERIQSMSQEIQRNNDFSEMLKSLEKIIWDSYQIGDYCIWIYYSESDDLRPYSLQQRWSEYSLGDRLKRISFSETGSIHRLVFEKKRSIFLPKLKKISVGSSEDYNREFLGMESLFAIPCIVKNKSFAVLTFTDLSPEFSRDSSIKGVKKLTLKQRDEIEQLVSLIANPLYQSLQKGILEKAFKDLQETQSQLIEAERMASLGQLVGGIAHEINNPIAVIRSNTELLGINNRVTQRDIPNFIDTLDIEEKELFYQIIDKSLQSREFLNTREERKRREEIQKQLSTLISDTNKHATIAKQITLLRLPSPYDLYIKTLGEDKFQKFLSMAEVFKNQSNSLSSIEIAVEKASRIVFALRSYLNTGLNNARKEVNLPKELEKALHVYDNYVIGKINVSTDFPSELKYTCISENMLQVWKNILFNAIQAMYNTEKELSIKIESVEKIPESLKEYRTSSIVEESLFQREDVKSWIVVSITDSGVGIPDELQEKIFTPFFTTKSTGEGIGLGLYTCKKIIHEHGGSLFFRSGGGSTEFVVVLVVSG